MTSARINVLNKGATDLRHIALSARVGLDLVELELTHRFANCSSAESIEIQYSFPVPAAAVLLSLTARIGDRELVGVAKPRLDAQDDYDEAVSEGESAVLVERTADGMYSLNLGHLGAGEDAELSYRYAFPAPWQSGQLRLALPTCIAPRYGRPDAMEDWQVPVSNALAEHRVSFVIELEQELSAAVVSSPTHEIHRSAEKILLARETSFADRDFVALIEHDVSQQPARCVWATETDATDSPGVACINVTVPKDDQQQLPRRVHFLLDSSGSMQGDSIRLGKEALLAALKRLTDEDQFALSAFGTTVEHASLGFVPATGDNKAAAIRWIRGRDANLGGTEIRGAVESCLSRYAKAEAADMLILTDGEFWEADDIIEVAKRHGSRLFTVGIGAAPAAEQIHKMADGSGASAEFLTPNEEFAGALERMVTRMRYSGRVEVAVDWGVQMDWQEPAQCLAWPGERVSVFCRGCRTETVTVRAGLSQPASIPCSDGELDIARIGWSRHIDTLVHSGKTNDALATQSATLGLVNDLTSMVMLDPQHVVVGGDSPDLHQVPQMLAAGWGGAGTVREDFLSAPAFLRVSADEAPPRAMFSRRRVSSNDNAPAAATPEILMTEARQCLSSDPMDKVQMLFDEAARLLAHLDPATVLDELATRIPELMGEEFSTVAGKLQKQGHDPREFVAAILEKALAHKDARQAFGFFVRRKLRRYLKANRVPVDVMEATDELLGAVSA